MKTVTEVYLVRHAHSVYTPDERGRPLSMTGRRATEAVAKTLKGCGIEALISSPYQRAIETIEPLARSLACELATEEDLRERELGFIGEEEFMAAAERTWRDFDYRFPGGESNREAQQRGVSVVCTIVREFSGQRIAVSTHGTLMSLIMNYFDNQFDFDFWTRLTMPDIYRLSFENGRYVSAARVFTD